MMVWDSLLTNIYDKLPGIFQRLLMSSISSNRHDTKVVAASHIQTRIYYLRNNTWCYFKCSPVHDVWDCSRHVRLFEWINLVSMSLRCHMQVELIRQTTRLALLWQTDNDCTSGAQTPHCGMTQLYYHEDPGSCRISFTLCGIFLYNYHLFVDGLFHFTKVGYIPIGLVILVF